MKLLVIDRSPPCDLLQGNALIGKHLFSRLRHHHLTLICPAPAAKLAHYQEILGEMFDVVHLVPRERPIGALLGLLEPTLSRRGISLGGRVEVAAVQAFERQVREVIAAGEFDAVHVRQLPMAAYVAPRQQPPALLELIDSETLQSVRRLKRKKPRTWLRYLSARVMEQRTLRRFAVATVVADPDAAVVRKLAPRTDVQVVPNGVDAAYYAPLELSEEPDSIVFTGAMSFPPNVSAVLYFVEQILPLIRRERPQVRFVIAGRDPAPAIAKLAEDPSITVTGMVDDMRPYLARAGVMVCPMVSGSGIKNKVLEALAMARPVVSTTLGIEALECTDGRELRIADEPAAFARAVVDLLGDAAARRSMGQAGRALVLRRYTWDACAESYERIYAALAQGASQPRRAPREQAPLKDAAS